MRLALALVFASNLYAQESDYAPQEKREAGPITFHVIPEVAIGAAFRNQSFSASTTEVFGQVRIPGLRFQALNETSTGFAVEFFDAPTYAGGLGFRFLSYTRVPVAAGFFTGVDIRFAQGSDLTGTEASPAGTAIVGFDFVEFFDTAKFSIELGLFTPNEPVRATLVLSF